MHLILAWIPLRNPSGSDWRCSRSGLSGVGSTPCRLTQSLNAAKAGGTPLWELGLRVFRGFCFGGFGAVIVGAAGAAGGAGADCPLPELPDSDFFGADGVCFFGLVGFCCARVWVGDESSSSPPHPTTAVMPTAIAATTQTPKLRLRRIKAGSLASPAQFC